MAKNLSAKQIISWKNKVDSAITKKLVVSLKRSQDAVDKLIKATESDNQDSNDLNYRFKSLRHVTVEAQKQLTLFMKSFDNSLTAYVKTVEKSEKSTAEKIRKSIDNFDEVAAKIAKLKM